MKRSINDALYRYSINRDSECSSIKVESKRHQIFGVFSLDKASSVAGAANANDNITMKCYVCLYILCRMSSPFAQAYQAYQRPFFSIRFSILKQLTIAIFCLIVICWVACGTSLPSNRESYMIGTQEWMAHSLTTSNFNNGDPIEIAPTEEAFASCGKRHVPACFDLKDASGLTVARIYNWYAVSDPRGLAPKGWHIPSEADIHILLTEMAKRPSLPSIKKVNGLLPVKSSEIYFDTLDGHQTNLNSWRVHSQYWTATQMPKYEGSAYTMIYTLHAFKPEAFEELFITNPEREINYDFERDSKSSWAAMFGYNQAKLDSLKNEKMVPVKYAQSLLDSPSKWIYNGDYLVQVITMKGEKKKDGYLVRCVRDYE